jgi:hypothetical protein
MKEKQKFNSTRIFQLLPHVRIHAFNNLGIGMSGMCILHCLLTPLALVALPFLETLHHWVHPVLALMIVPVTLLAMWTGFRQHRRPSVLLPLGVGLLIVLTSSWFAHEDLYLSVEAEFGFLGSGLLMIGHWWNRQAGKAC